MVTFVRLLACAELVGGVVLLWLALVPYEPTVDELAAQVARGDFTVPNSDPISPAYGLALFCAGTISLAATTRTTSAPPPSA